MLFLPVKEERTASITYSCYAAPVTLVKATRFSTFESTCVTFTYKGQGKGPGWIVRRPVCTKAAAESCHVKSIPR